MGLIRIGLLPLLAVGLTACPPPIYPKHVGDYDLVYAKRYFTATQGKAGDLAPLTNEQLYALYRYSRERFHHPPAIGGALVERGGTAAAFLRHKLEAAQNERTVSAILTLLRAMQRQGIHDVRSDPQFIALIQREAAEHDAKHGGLRDLADDIATNSELPTTLYGWLEPLLTGRDDSDYDEDFAKQYCEGCDYRETMREAATLPIDQLYSLQRFNWDRDWPRNFNRYMARRGAQAASLYKLKLGGETSNEMLWVIMSTLELMRDLGTYEVAGDSELMRLAEAAVARTTGWRQSENQAILQRLKSGTPHPFLKADQR